LLAHADQTKRFPPLLVENIEQQGDIPGPIDHHGDLDNIGARPPTHLDHGPQLLHVGRLL